MSEFKAQTLLHMRREFKLQLVRKFLYDQKKHLQGTGASTSAKAIVCLLYVFCGDERDFYSVRRNGGLVLPAA